MQQTVYHHTSTLDLPGIKRVSFNAPLKWLALGWRDYLQSPWSSSFYGLVFVLLGYAVTAATTDQEARTTLLVSDVALVARVQGPDLAAVAFRDGQRNK